MRLITLSITKQHWSRHTYGISWICSLIHCTYVESTIGDCVLVNFSLSSKRLWYTLTSQPLKRTRKLDLATNSSDHFVFFFCQYQGHPYFCFSFSLLCVSPCLQQLRVSECVGGFPNIHLSQWHWLSGIESSQNSYIQSFFVCNHKSPGLLNQEMVIV